MLSLCLAKAYAPKCIVQAAKLRGLAKVCHPYISTRVGMRHFTRYLDHADGVVGGACRQGTDITVPCDRSICSNLQTSLFSSVQKIVYMYSTPFFLQNSPNLRPRNHNFILSAKISSCDDYDFITRMLFHDVHWRCFLLSQLF